MEYHNPNSNLRLISGTVYLMLLSWHLLLCVRYVYIGPDYYAPYKADEELILPDYNEFVSGLVKDGCYSDMLTVLALSSVVPD